MHREVVFAVEGLVLVVADPARVVEVRSVRRLDRVAPVVEVHPYGQNVLVRVGDSR